jgi:chemotaxis protein methyltransferase CheR
VATSPQKNNITHEELISDKVGFESLSKILLTRTGIFMDPSEKNFSLMSNRMHRVLKKHNCYSYTDFIKLIDAGNNEVITEFLEVLTTNTTHFFRENEHFIYLKKHLPLIEEYLMKERRSEIRVWCAAASTGEEPYTILMTILEYLGATPKFSVKVVATDINTQVLEKAKEGIYKNEISENVAPDLILKYFEKNQKIPIDCLQVKEKYRNMIEFSKLNLMSDIYIFPHKYDIIFCRNVMIYFTQKVVEETIIKLSNCLEKKGYLFIGHSEAMLGDRHKLKSVTPAIYQHAV